MTDTLPVRPPAVAGQFYPADSGHLAHEVDALLAAAPFGPPARAYVVPHAGYQYSGSTAAHVYRGLRARRIVLIGPSHFLAISGCAVPAAAAWRTPLGTMPIDVDAGDALVSAGLVARHDSPHAAEHSLEVQVPFLQRTVGSGVPVLPIAVGRATADEVAAVLAACAHGAVVLCSTDLSHYLDESAARVADTRTLEAIAELDPTKIGTVDACGAFALRGLLRWAASESLVPALVHRTTSADHGGDPHRVVGYAAVAMVRP